ncbi:MAG TPA: HlyD family type I secretion periplasmic adaptor subunit [Stellaceae bacterium]|nr:HlyD family type I secretion periplasmic adaptor subunit [Stellaceae bacterium]
MRLSRSVPARRSEPAPSHVVRLFQSETAEILEAPEPIRARIAVFTLAACFVSLIVIAALLPIDRVVTSSGGFIVPADQPLVIQALDASVIKTIDVREGEIVKKGQLLATLDPTFTTADVDALRLQIASLDAEIARCEAELAHAPFDPRPSATPGAASYATLQKVLYNQRKAQFAAQLQSFDQQIAQLQATVAKFQGDETRYAERARISKEVEDMRAALAKQQVGSRLNLLAATDERLEILRNVEFDHNSLRESQHQLDATVANRNAFIQQWLGEASKELVQARNSRDTALQQLVKASGHQALVQLRAPVDAIVLELQKVPVGTQLQKLSVGSVLTPGETLVTLASLSSPMEAELQISSRDVGFIRPGDRATLKIDAFNFVEHGTAAGEVRWISDGSFTVSPEGQPVPPYYKVRLRLTRVKLRNVPEDFRLLPGMTLTGDIHVGEHSLLMYLFGSMASLGEAMREP